MKKYIILLFGVLMAAFFRIVMPSKWGKAAVFRNGVQFKSVIIAEQGK